VEPCCRLCWLECGCRTTVVVSHDDGTTLDKVLGGGSNGEWWHVARPTQLCPEHVTHRKTSQGKRVRTDGLMHDLKAFNSRRGQVEALHAREDTAAPVHVHAGQLAGRHSSDGRGVQPCVRATSPRHSLGPPRRCPGTRTPEQRGTTRGRGKTKCRRARAL
jgi:hypothetical protein